MLSQSRVGAKERAHAGIATGQLQHDETGGRHTHTRATIALDSRSGDVEGRELGDEFKRELGPLPVVVDDGDHLLITEGPHCIANATFFFRQQLIYQIKIGPE